MGVPCIVGCGHGAVTTLEGRTVTVSATTGLVYEGRLPIVAHSETDDPDLALVSDWVRTELGADVVAPLPDMIRLRSGGLPPERTSHRN
jgi:pyruvate,orthophosphate dikinase